MTMKKKICKTVGPLKLKYSRVVRPKLNQLGELKDTRGFRYTRRTKKDETLPRSIQLYRYWFLYLKLALELESHGYCFREYQRVQIKKKKGDVAGKRTILKEIPEPVIVNKKRYEEWDLDSVREDSFDKWWKSHSSLFVEDPTEEIFKNSQITDTVHHRYFKIDTRKPITDTMNELKHHLSKHMKRRRVVSDSQWNIKGEFREEALFNRYNALIMNIEGMKSPDILKSRLFRKTRGMKITRSSNSQENSQKMRDLLNPAKRLVLTVADGYFMKHPNKKIYFKRKKKKTK